MKFIRLFNSLQDFENVKSELEKPFVVYTMDDGSIWLSDEVNTDSDESENEFSPLTKVWYLDGSYAEFDIVGSLQGSSWDYMGMNIKYATTKITNVNNAVCIKIGNTVTDINETAFYNCYNLEEINIPNTVTNISTAFAYCSGLKRINSSVDGIFNIPNSVSRIYGSFEKCECLTNVYIPDGVTDISLNTFSNCINLTDVHIPNTVISFGIKSFYNCPKLTNIYYNGTINQWNNINKLAGWRSTSNALQVQCTDGVTYEHRS